MSSQSAPLKLYIQDIFRANKTEHKYIYELFGTTFKNVMIHGVITAIFNSSDTKTNIEVSDATGSVLVYFDCKKNNFHVTDQTYKDMIQGFAAISKSHHDKTVVMSKLLDRIVKKKIKPLNFEEGDYITVVGDIFLDNVRKIRMVSAFNCDLSSIDRDIVWMEELRYIYEKFYLWEKMP